MISHFAVNWLAVVLAAIASFAFGAVWYMSLSNRWLAALGKTREQLQVGNTPFIWSIAMELVMAYFIALLTPALTGEVTIVSGMVVGAHMWLGFVITTLILNHRYEGMRWSLTIIDGLHLLGVLVIQGLVTGRFG
ncbi:MAG TPA: DUF1761 domain-containing protein [Devosia sp.]